MWIDLSRRFFFRVLFSLWVAFCAVAVGLSAEPNATQSGTPRGGAIVNSQGTNSVQTTNVVRYIVRSKEIPFVRGEPRTYFFEVGQQKYEDLDSFKGFVRSLPKGSVVYWRTACLLFTHLPLPKSDMTIQQFREYCLGLGVKFDYECVGF